jgi:CrcB protein
MEWKFFLLVASGGAIGSLFRAFIAHICRSWLPWPTILVNIIGAFLIGICIKHWEQNSQNDLFRAFWIIGLCGGFTTFSTFGLDALNFLKSAQWLNALIYVSLNFLGTLLAIFLGFRIYAWTNS